MFGIKDFKTKIMTHRKTFDVSMYHSVFHHLISQQSRRHFELDILLYGLVSLLRRCAVGSFSDLDKVFG